LIDSIRLLRKKNPTHARSRAAFAQQVIVVLLHICHLGSLGCSFLCEEEAIHPVYIATTREASHLPISSSTAYTVLIATWSLTVNMSDTTNTIRRHSIGKKRVYRHLSLEGGGEGLDGDGSTNDGELYDDDASDNDDAHGEDRLQLHATLNAGDSFDGGGSRRGEYEADITVDQAIERLGMGPFQLVILVASGLCFAADGMQIQILSFLTVVLEDEWSLSPAAAASLESSIFVGALLGTLLLGPLADRIGRRPVFLITSTIICVFGVASAATTHYYAILATIFLIGVGVGGLVVPFDMLAEALPSASRGTNLLVIEYFWTAGCLYVVVMADFTLSGRIASTDGADNDATDAGPAWRLFVVLCTLPCMAAVFIGCAFVPESARWLASQGRMKDSMVVLKKAAALNFGGNGQSRWYHWGPFAPSTMIRVPTADNDDDISHVGSSDPSLERALSVFPPGTRLIEDEHGEHHHKEASIADLFQPKWREITLRLWGTWAASAFGYYGTMITTTAVFASTGDATSPPSTPPLGGGGEMLRSLQEYEEENHSQHRHSFDYTAIFVSSSAEIVGTTLVLLTIDRWGRIPLQVYSYGLAGILVCLLCILAWYEASRLILLSIGFCARVFEMSGTCVTWVSTAEILTTEVRSTGHATANACARIGAFFAPYIIAGENSGNGMVKLGVIMLFIHLFTAVCVSKLPETMGKSMGAVDDEENVDNDINLAPDDGTDSNERLMLGRSSDDVGEAGTSFFVEADGSDQQKGFERDTVHNVVPALGDRDETRSIT